MDHPNVIRYYEAFAFAQAYYLVFELAAGGELYHHIDEYDFQEPGIAIMLQQLLHAMNYFHGQGIVHADLRPENILLAAPLSVRPQLKIIHFGNAFRMEGGRKPAS